MNNSTAQFSDIEYKMSEAMISCEDLAPEINRIVHGIFRAAHSSGLTPNQILQYVHVQVEKKRRLLL